MANNSFGKAKLFLTLFALGATVATGVVTGCTDNSVPKDIYVSKNGADNGKGTEESPYSSIEKALSSIGKNKSANIYVMSEDMPFSDINHGGLVTYKAYDENASLSYDESITLSGPSSFEIRLPEYSDRYIITGGNALTMESFTKAPSKKGEAASSPMVITGGGENNIFTLTDGFADTVATRVKGEISGKSVINVDGGTIRQIVIGAVTDEEDASLSGTTDKDGADEDVGKKSWDTIVTDVTVTVNDGAVLYIKDGWCKPNADGALTLIFNHNSAKKLMKNELTTVFDGGMWLLRSLDTDGNKIEATDKNGVFNVSGSMTAYTMSDDGKKGFASKDGKLCLPEGSYTIDWNAEFTTSLFASPSVENGYSFGGWIETSPGVYEAAIIKESSVYVSKDGNDENNGFVKQTPFKTLNKAIDALDNGGTVHILDEADFADGVAFDGNIEITGGKLILKKDTLTLGGNTTLSDISVVSSSKTGVINTCGFAFETKENVLFTDKNSNQADFTINSDARNISVSSGSVDTLNVSGDLENTKISVGGAKIATLSIAEASENADIKGYIKNGEIANISTNGSKASVQIISETTSPKVESYDNVWTLSAENMGASRISFTDVPGTFAVSAEYGKTPVAIDENGKAYIGEALTVPEEKPYTDYKENDYKKHITYRSSLKNTYKKLTVDKELSVVYFGGSVTNGSVTECWRKLTSDWLSESFPEADITFTNSASGESGTFLGAYRVQRDVIGFEPDLVFLEYCINDKYYYGSNDEARINASKGCETIVREIKKARPDCDIVIIIVTDSGVRNQALFPTALGHNAVAETYGISTINVGQALMEHIYAEHEGYSFSSTSDEVWKIYFRDIVHLTEEGNKPYFYAIREFLTNSLFHTDYDGKLAIRNPLPPVMNVHLNDGDRKTVSPTEETATANGSYGLTFADVNYPLNYNGRLTANRAEDNLLVYNFKGTEIAIYTSIKGSIGGRTQYSVDGGEWKEITHKNHGPNLVISDIPEKILPDGTKTTEHTISLRPIWDGVDAETESIHYGIICTRDATVQSVKGDIHEYTDFTSTNLVLPEGSYTVIFADKNELSKYTK